MSLYHGFPPGTRPASERITFAGCLSGAARSHTLPAALPLFLSVLAGPGFFGRQRRCFEQFLLYIIYM